MRLTAIFFDLDETLVHSRTASQAGAGWASGATRYGPYLARRRRCAPELLALARGTGAQVYMCTTSERGYADGLSRVFGLGFAENQILGYEHLTSGRTGLAPGAVLIDDLGHEHEIAQFKRRVLGIEPGRHWQVPAYHGHNDPEPDVVRGLGGFLQRFEFRP